MQKRFIFSAIAGVLVLAVLTVFVARNAIPVSARQIMERAYDVQERQAAAQGIQHIRSEIYTNVEALPEEQGMNWTVESYFDIDGGNFRLVGTDNKTGSVTEAYAYDGSYVYNSASLKGDQQSADTLTIYRTPQNEPSAVSPKLRLRYGIDGLDSKTMFEKMRSDPDVQFAGKESWEGGLEVYALRSQGPVKVMAGDQVQTPEGVIILYFDVESYRLLGSRVTIEKEGKELLISSERTVLSEILPAGESVDWSLSDLQGVSIVDNINNEQPAFEVISAEELAAKTQSAYLLETIPEGFSLEINILQEQQADEAFFYNATYTHGKEYFMIRVWGEPVKDASWGDETYTTASGLVLHFIVEPGVTDTGGQFTSALVEAPNGMTYAVNSTLPRDETKALVEQLVLLK